MPPQLDSYGLDYGDLLKIQREGLTLWRTKLRPSLLDEIAEYVRSHNKAAGRDGRHQVFRGNDILELARTWPELPPCYPPRVEETCDVI